MKTIRLDRIFIALFFVWVLLLTIAPAHDGDIWFNLKSGQAMCEAGQVFTHDIFSFTRAGAEWVNRLWLFQIVLYLVFSVFSWTGIVLMKTAIIVLTFHFLLKPYYKNENIAFILIIAMIGTLAMQSRLRIRPEIISFLFLAFTFYAIEQYRQRHDGRILIPLPFLMIVWVNVHGLYILGFFIEAACLAEIALMLIQKKHKGASTEQAYSDLIKLAVVFVISIAGLLFNPFGLKGAIVPFEQWQMIANNSFFLNIQELMPSAVYLMRKGMSVTTISTLGLLVIAVAVIVWHIIRTRSIPIFYLLVFCAFVYLGVKINRNIALFSIIAIAVSSALINQFKITAPYRMISTIVCGGLTVVLLYSGMVWTIDTYKVQDGLERLGITSYLRSPENVVRFLKENRIAGKIYSNRMLFGNYYLWELGPQQKVFWDGRLEIYGEEFFREAIMSVNTKNTFDRFIAAYDFDCLVFAYRTTYESDKGENMYERLVELYQSPAWKLVYVDSYYCVFLKAATNNEAMNAVSELHMPTTRADAERFIAAIEWNVPVGDVNGRIEEYYSLARIAHWFDSLVLVEYITDLCVVTAPKNSYTVILQGKRDISAGNYEKAYELLTKAISDNSKIIVLVADVAFKLGKFEESIQYLKQFIKRYPNNLLAYLRLADCYYALGKREDALAALDVVLTHDPQNLVARKNYAILVVEMEGY